MLGESTPEETGEVEGSASSVPPADSEDDASASRKRDRASEEPEGDSSASSSSGYVDPLDVAPLRSAPPKATPAKKRCLNPHWAGALPTVISSGE